MTHVKPTQIRFQNPAVGDDSKSLQAEKPDIVSEHAMTLWPFKK